MKSIFCLSLFFVASAALAYNQNTDWSTLFASRNVTFVHREYFGNIPLNKACLTEKFVQTKEPITYCAKLSPKKKGENKDKFTDWVCETWVHGIYSYTRHTSQGFVADEIKVLVRVGDNTSRAYRFFKNFEFPDCF